MAWLFAAVEFVLKRRVTLGICFPRGAPLFQDITAAIPYAPLRE